MKAIGESPILTELHDSVDDFQPEPGSVYVVGESPEERSKHTSRWNGQCSDVRFIHVFDQTLSDFKAQVDDTTPLQCHLRSRRELDGLVGRLEQRQTYVDITGLIHAVWAPLVRAVLEAGIDLSVVYVEPADYAPSRLPTKGQIFDLSERIQGIAPLPGFASLVATDTRDAWFVPLLGFEGPRFAYMLEQVQPLGERIIPVVGVPGFRLEFPFHTYLGNSHVLGESQSWRRVRYATANCPFCLFHTLADIHHTHCDQLLKIALIGTKPHALGAVLYHLSGLGPTELVYDHPVGESKRTEGSARLLTYHVSVLMRDVVG